ncbi:MAG: T9SS type B sorting domain-containing protein [Bacteroidetes bacterium]|nr:MAG: T9SS type B sorting domain-containing protein [Bacteroidota bacterium]
MSKHIIIVLFIVLLSSVSDGFSQLQVTPNPNAAQLVQTLAGAGVTVSGATINCPVGASGTFNGTASNIGISGGILLTTGNVADAVGPNNLTSAGTAAGVNFSDPNLIQIEPDAKYNPCVLEFDVVPSCSTLAFTFVFGSEEYHDYVPSSSNPLSVNDVFGIFVTGPNPSGPAYAGYNMAMIPSTTLPVGIFNINNGFTLGCASTGPCNNCAYFTDNCNGTSVQYDGFTKPITLTINVIPCVTYHFKLAIADAYDEFWDSGVFFELQSLACNPLPVLVGTTSTPSACTANNGSASATPTGGTPPYTYSWNTTPPQNTQTATGLSPGNYTVSVTDATGCFSNTGTITVGGGGGFTTTNAKADVACFGGVGSATVTPTGGNLPYTYAWNTVPVQTNPNISNIPAGTYTCVIADAAGCVQTVVITITQPPPITVAITNTVNVSCPFGNDGSVSAVGGGGAAPYNYSWNTTPVQAGAAVSNLSAGNYVVTVSDAQGCATTQSVTIMEPAPMTFLSNAVMASCGMADGSATITPSGGAQPYTFLWLTTPAVQTTPTAVNLITGTYTVIITDANGCLQNQNVFVPGGVPPIADFYFSPDIVNLQDPMVYFTDASGGVISDWHWNFGDWYAAGSDTSNQQNSSYSYSDTGIYCITLVIKNPSGLCADSITKCLKVEAPSTFYIPNTFTPNYDGLNEIFMGYGTYIKEFHMYIFDRWGNLIFESNDLYKGWNGAVNNSGDIVQEDVYVWKVRLIDANEDEYNYLGHVNLIK